MWKKTKYVALTVCVLEKYINGSNKKAISIFPIAWHILVLKTALKDGDKNCMKPWVTKSWESLKRYAITIISVQFKK